MDDSGSSVIWDRNDQEGLPSLVKPDPFFISAYEQPADRVFTKPGTALDLAAGLRNPCPRSPSSTGESFAHREVAGSGNRAGPAKKRTFAGVSGFLEFLTHDASLGNTRFARCIFQPLRQILRQPNGNCITHLLNCNTSAVASAGPSNAMPPGTTPSLSSSATRLPAAPVLPRPRVCSRSRIRPASPVACMWGRPSPLVVCLLGRIVTANQDESGESSPGVRCGTP
jgi:hypothetical protein